MPKLMIDTSELSELLGITNRKANDILREVNNELKEQGYLIVNTRPLKAPRKIVLERLNIQEEQ